MCGLHARMNRAVSCSILAKESDRVEGERDLKKRRKKKTLTDF
jgi:hypothetical protein